MAEGAESGNNPPASPAGSASIERNVFITYATADLAAAQAVCEALEHARLTCWMAPRDVMPGD